MRLREIREKSKKSQIEVAAHLGVSRQCYNNYELENREPNSEMLTKIADYFGVSVDYLIGREEHSKLTKKDEKEITEIMEQYKNQLLTTDGLMFDGEPVTEEDMRFILSALQASMETIKIKNKEKFTPKKYRK